MRNEKKYRAATSQSMGEIIEMIDKDGSSRDDLRPEYDSSELKGGVQGKYAERFHAGTNLALLAPEVRAAFPTDDAVNQALRSVMQDQSV